MPLIGLNFSDKVQAILDKLDELKQQQINLSAGMADLLTAQNVTNSKLDDLITAINNQTTALGAGQLDQAGVTAAINDSSLIGNVFSAIQGLGGGTDLAALLAAISAMRGVDQRTLTDLFNKPTAELSGDVTIDLTTTNERLLWIRDGLLDLRGYTGERLTLVEIRDAIQALAGPAPGATLTDVRNAIFGMQGPVGNQATLADLLEPWDAGQGITAYNLLDALRSEAITRNNLLEQIEAEWNSGAGITPYNLLDSIRSNSISMVACCEAQSGGVAPPGSGEGSCSGTEYVSVGMEEYTDINSNETGMVATWSAVPAGFQLFDSRNLSPSAAGWDGYSVWVQSTASSFRLNLVDSNRYPTNRWVDLSALGSTLLLFGVDVGNNLSVTLCGPEVVGGDCVNADSQLLLSSRWVAYLHLIVWPEVPGFTRQMRNATDPSDNYAGYVSLWGNFTGWKIHAFKETTPHNPNWMFSGVVRNNTTGELFGSGAISVNYSPSAGSQHPFRVELCPV